MSTQLTADQVHQMYRERRYEEIDAARTEGRLALVLGTPPEEVALIDRAEFSTLTRADVQALAALNRHDLIETARTAGRIQYDDTEGA